VFAETVAYQPKVDGGGGSGSGGAPIRKSRRRWHETDISMGGEVRLAQWSSNPLPPTAAVRDLPR